MEASRRRSSGEGFPLTQNKRKSANFTSDSCSSSSGVADANPLALDFRRRSSRQPAGTPMKHLLAKEMSKESETRTRSQSVIARLMGLEGLPSPQLVPKPQTRQHVTSNVDKAEKSSLFSSHRSSRESSKEEQEFKDVFEVVEAPKIDKSRSTIGSDEMDFIREKFMEAKRLSTDDKLQDSKEFHDAIAVLSSNRELLLKFLHYPNSLFTKHMNDLEVAPFPSNFSRISTAKSSKARPCDPSCHGFSSGRERLPKRSSKSSPKRKGNQAGQPYYSSPDPLKPSKLEERKDSDVVPTRIVVLKPNLGKVNRTIRCPSPPPTRSPLSDSSSLKEFPCSRSKVEKGRRQKLNSDIDLSLQFKGSQEIAKQITTKVENEYDSGSPNIMPLSGYWGESSSTVSMNDSANESDITILTSTKSPNFNSQCKLASCRGESSVAWEAKRRLSRRWKITHKSEDMTELNWGSTLAHMLATPVLDARCPNKDRNGRKGFVASCLSDDLGEPLGISSRDGWKDVCENNLSRPRSVPSSSNLSGSPRANADCEAYHNYSYTIPRETLRREKNKKIVSHVDPRDALAQRKSRSRESKRHPDNFIREEASSASLEFHPRQNQPKASVMEMGPLRSPLVSETSTGYAHEYLQLEHLTVPSTPETLCSQLPTPFLCSSYGGRVSKEYSEQSAKGTLGPLHHHVPELQSPASSKEADQPSPVSTLEAPFTDDLSSGSMCFESPSADLHGLHMQLQLLRVESEANGEGTAIILGDDDIGEGPCNLLEYGATHKIEGCWEFSYVTDIFVHSGYVDFIPETFVSKLHSPESPVVPSMFEELENKHSSGSSSRVERKLLFDLLNSELKEIYSKLTGPNPWVTATGSASGIKLSIDGLRTSVVGQYKKVIEGTLDNVLMNESLWLNLGEDIDAVVKDMKKLLADELVAELVEELL